MNKLNLLIFILFLCVFCLFDPASAKADDNLNIRCHYYVADPTSPNKYKEKVTWQILTVSEWSKIDTNASKFEQIRIPNPGFMDGVHDFIHIEQKNSDQLSGTNYYLYQGGVIKIANIPTDSYSVTDPSFRRFLDDEMKTKSAFTNTTDLDLKVTDPGIVVVYNASRSLKNPIWLLSSEEQMAPYTKYIKAQTPIDAASAASEAKNERYNALDTYLLYLNLPHAPAQLVTIANRGDLRLTTINVIQTQYNDTLDLYDYFRDQADRAYISQQSEAQRELLKTKKKDNAF